MAVPAVCRVLAAVFLTASLVSGTPCPSDWWQSGAWCYRTSESSTLSWAGAADFCEEHGGALVSIKDRNKLLDVVDLLKAVGDDKRWWIGIQKREGSTEARNDTVYDNFGEEKVIKIASSGESGSHLCVYMTASDGLWYWTACDTALHYICQKEADRVPVVVVSPDRSRPDLAWLQAHEAALAATITITPSDDDDKGEYSASKATMTPILTTTSTAAPPTRAVTEPAASATPGPATTTASPCSGNNWWMLAGRCNHLFLSAKSWSDAEQFCQAKGGYLTQFDDEAAQTKFRDQYSFNSGSIWIGMALYPGSHSYVWGQAHPLPSFPGWTADQARQPTYSTWAPGQPTRPINGAKSCVALDLSTNLWVTESCSMAKPFSCSRAVNATEQPPTVATTTATVAAPCGGGGWWQFGRTCLLLVSDTPASWHAAELACRNKSATQVKVDSFQLNTHLRGKLGGVSAWIGLSKLNSPAGVYKWTDGSIVDFNRWAAGTASSADMASCAQIDATHSYWRPVNCNAPQPFVCQRPASGAAPQLPPPPRPAPRSSCPPAWQPYGADRCLKLFPQPTSWQEARQGCRAQADGADLLSVPSAVHQAFLTSAVQESPDRVWISLSHAELEGRQFLTWTDESPVNYTSWAPAQPSGPCPSCPKTCAVVDGRRTITPAAWEDVDCSIPHGAICQRPAMPNNSLAVTQTFCNNTQYIAAADACYKIIHDEMTWPDALDYCQSDGSALAYIADLFDNAELVKLLYRDGRDQYWIGLSDSVRHGIMEWTKPWSASANFVNWDPSSPPASQRESCAAFVPVTGLWQKRPCSTDRRSFVCQRAPELEEANALVNHCNTQDGATWTAGDERCYRAFEPSGAGLDWTQAKADCEKQGYQLATAASLVDFRAIRDAVKALKSQFTAWIGLRSQQNKEYGWTDGSAVTYRSWYRREPVLPDGCGQASRLTAGRWQTADCRRTAAFVCMQGMNSAGGTSAITSEGEAAAGGSAWGAVGVVFLVLAMTVTLAGVGLWFARRQRVAWLPVWLQGTRAQHHSVENLSYSRQHNADSTEGTLENGSLNAIAANRWGSQEQLVITEDH